MATLFSLGGIAAAIVLDPTFSQASDGLSDLGVRDRSAPVFNWGLILGGLVGGGYAVGLERKASSGRNERDHFGFGRSVTGLALPELPGAVMLAAWGWAFGPLPVLDCAAITARLGADADP